MPSMSLRPTLPGSVCSELVTSLIVASGTVKTVESCLVKNVSPVSWMTSFPLIFSGNPVLPWMYSTSGNTSCAQTPTGSATMAAVANTAVTSLICSLRPHVASSERSVVPPPHQAQRTCHNETHNRATVITYDDFLKVDIRVGRIVQVDDFPKAKKPAYKLRIDFGELGVKASSAQIVKHYDKTELLGQLVLAVVNFPPRQIADFFSEVLTLGLIVGDGDVVLVHPDREVPLGAPLR